MNEVFFIPRSILDQGDTSDVGTRASYQNRFRDQLRAARVTGAGLIKLKHAESGNVFFYACKLKSLVLNLENNIPQSNLQKQGGFLWVLPNFRDDPIMRDSLYFYDESNNFEFAGLHSLSRELRWGIVNDEELELLKEDCEESNIHLPLDRIATFSTQTQGAFIANDTRTNNIIGAIPVFRLNALNDQELFPFLCRYSLFPEYKDDNAQIDDVLEKLLNQDKERAALETLDKTRYEDSTRGLWSLWPYTCYTAQTPPADLKENWFDLRSYAKRVYARNPMDDIVGANGEYAAIDFGTTSTTVAVWYQNHMSMFQISGYSARLSADRSRGEEFSHKYENPTVLSFENVDRFLRAYSSELDVSPPNTKISDVDVAGSALEKLRGALKQNNLDIVGKIQSQLKQWADDDGRIVSIHYGGQNHALRYSRLTQEDPDPIEIYAYYIGLTLNNLASGKIWTNYLLSYSATYVERNIERIRSSFERGLRRSLPQPVPKEADICVQQYCDEATAYAVAAFLRYREQAWMHDTGRFNSRGSAHLQTHKIDVKELPNLKEYESMLKNGLLYGIYDFGGGTLDFSFGLIVQDAWGSLIFKPLDQGGASYSGCENIMERLALSIFEQNASLCQQYDVEYVKPMVFSEPSIYARFNTLQLIELLRTHWRAEPSSEELLNTPFYIYNKRGDQLLFQLSKEKTEREGKTYYFTIGDIDKDMEHILQNSVRQFFEQIDNTVANHRIPRETPYCIFLGGNASRSPRLNKVFEAALESRKQMAIAENRCYLHPPLPTDYDAEYGNGLPNAKSGVVYGLLHARPSSQICRIDMAEQKLRVFDYHIGVAASSRYSAEGKFCLVASANELVPGHPRPIRPIPVNGGLMELLYTKNAEYGKSVDRDLPATGEGIYSLQLSIDRQWGGWVLYCEACDVPGELKIGVALNENSQITWIGRCRFFEQNKYTAF